MHIPLSALQILQNKAARLVVKKGLYTPTRTLLKECGWLSLRQLVFYHTVLSVHKITVTGKPLQLKKKFSQEYSYQTRQATGGGVRLVADQRCKSKLASNGFCNRGVSEYNRLPNSVRKVNSLGIFKAKLKDWIKCNIPID